MENLIWFLLIGGLVFWMMRKGGCGMSHGGHGGDKEEHSQHNDDDGAEKKEPAPASKRRGCH